MATSTSIFYGWWVVLVSGIGLSVCYISTVSFTFGVFLPSLAREFNWSRYQISTAFSLSLIAMCFAMPVIGHLVDRFGAKKVILPAVTVLGLCVASLALLSSNLWHFYAVFMAMGVVGAGTTPLPYSKVIARWFNLHRGLALGVTMVGLGLGSFAMPWLAHTSIRDFGWRGAYLVLGLAIILVTIPIVGLFLREDPEELGLCPDGEKSIVPTSLGPHRLEGVGIREAIQTPTFWLMCVVFFVMGTAVIGCLIHLVPMLVDRGMPAERAALATSFVGASLIVGRIGAGYLLDRFFASRVTFVFLIAVALAVLFFWQGGSTRLIFVATILLGIGLGADADIIPYLVSRYFGLRNFTEIYGYTNAAFSLGGVVGPLLMGLGFDTTGSYGSVLAGFLVGTIFAAGLVTWLKPYRYGLASASEIGSANMAET